MKVKVSKKVSTELLSLAWTSARHMSSSPTFHQLHTPFVQFLTILCPSCIISPTNCTQCLRWGHTSPEQDGTIPSLGHQQCWASYTLWYGWPSWLPKYTADSFSTCHQPRCPDPFPWGYSLASHHSGYPVHKPKLVEVHMTGDCPAL